jgi:2'-5' RNA ligase
MPDTHTIRSFIAFCFPENIIFRIKKLQEEMQKYKLKIRWVEPKNIHLTLKFLGNISHESIEKAGRVINETAGEQKPVSLIAKGIGVFPGIKHPRIIWVGVGRGTDRLIELQKNLDKKLVKAGFSKDKKPFTSHITIGRVNGKNVPENLMNAMAALKGFESEEFIADHIDMYKSDLKHGGPVYTRLMSVPFLEDII